MGSITLIIALVVGVLLGAALAWVALRGTGGKEIELLREERAARENELTRQRDEVVRLTGELAGSEQVNAGLEEKLADQKKELEETQKRLTTEFENLANRILAEKSKTFTEQNKLNMQQVLDPLGERLKEFQKTVQDTYVKGTQERSALKEQVQQMMDLNRKMTEEANNLTKALKGDPQVQGHWGEVILERLLETSGLKAGEEYVTQESVLAEDGSRSRTDVVVKLPDDKVIIIDSKVSLTDYERFMSTDEVEGKEVALAAHISSLRSHVRGLAAKNYSALYGMRSPDYVLMFVPIEPAFHLAVREDDQLFEEAFRQNVIIVPHTMLMVTLRTIASIWKQERIARNHLEIAERGGVLYDKFKLFTDDLISVGVKIEGAQKEYQEAMRKLSTSPGNLVRQAEMLKELGAKASKNLHVKLLERSLGESTPVTE